MTSLNDENKSQLFTPVDLELLLCSSGFTMHKPKTPVIALGLLISSLEERYLAVSSCV